MMRKYFGHFGLMLIPVLLGISGCKKAEGEGGKAEISGQVKVRNYQSPDFESGTDDLMRGEQVYIDYGADGGVDDDVRTDDMGRYQFSYLLPGKYRIYTYSLDPLSPGLAMVPVLNEIEITKRKSETESNFTIYLAADDDGTSSIRGKVRVRDYNSTFTTLVNSYYGADEDVYIIYGDGSTTHERVRSSYDGSFEFSGLRNGKYSVFAYSSDSAAFVDGVPNPPDIASIKTLAIYSNHSVNQIGEIVILK